ncbi:MAG: phosphate transport system permease protein [Natronomonas sp.]|jgi:phosphate transport system permease protein
MSGEYASTLVTDEATLGERVASMTVGLGLLVFLLSVLSIARVVTEEASVLGVGLYDFLAFGLLAMGLGVLAVGVGSALEWFATTPDETPGTVTAGAFGVIAAGVVWLSTVQLGVLGPFGGFPVGLLAGAATFVVLGLLPEDLGSTLPTVTVAVAVSGAVLTNRLTPAWLWDPEWLSAGFSGSMTIPTLLAVAALLTAWSGAKAYGGYGSEGRQAGAYLLVALNALGMLVVLLAIILFIVTKGMGPAFEGFSLSPFDWPFVLNGYSFRPDVVNGVFPAIVGTIYLVIGATITGVPVAVAAAVFLTEYAEQGPFVGAVEIATNGLWSTPSVVYGLFGYAFLVPRLGGTTSLLSGILVLGFMLMPLCLITSREAIKAVPDEYRDASAALGVSQWETIKSVVVPAAIPGIVTGVILGVGRIAGETAPILLVMSGGLRDDAPNVLGSFEFTSAPPFVANDALLQSSPALPYQLYATITSGVSAENAIEYGWGTAFVLLVVVLSFYAVGIATRMYFRRRLNYE